MKEEYVPRHEPAVSRILNYLDQFKNYDTILIPVALLSDLIESLLRK